MGHWNFGDSFNLHKFSYRGDGNELQTDGFGIDLTVYSG